MRAKILNLPGWLKEATTALAVMSAVAAVCFVELVRHPGDVLVGVHDGGSNDLTSYFIRFREFPARILRTGGAWPFWNPHFGLGGPVIGSPQTAAFYPPNWLCLICDPAHCLPWLIVAHHVFMGCGAFFLGRFWGLRTSSALLAGSTLTAAPYLVAHSAEGHYAQICVVAWAPWIWLAFERFRRSAGADWRAVTLCLTMSFLAGHAQETYYMVVLLSTVVAGEFLAGIFGGERRRALRMCGGWIKTGLAMLGLVAIDLFPIVAVTRIAARSGGLDLAGAGAGLRVANFRQLLDPFALGTPQTMTAAETGLYWCHLFHFGLIAGGLGLAGILFAWRRPGVRMLAGLLVLSIVFAFGNLTPVYTVLYRVLPGLASFRIPSRMLFLSSFFMAMLAGFAVDAWGRRRAAAPVEEAPGPAVPEPLWRWGNLVTALLLIASVAELSRHAQRVLATSPPDGLRRNAAISQFLAGKIGIQRVLAGQDVYGDTEAVSDGVLRVRGYEPVPLLRYVGVLDAMTTVAPSKIDFCGFEDVNLAQFHKPLVDLAGVRFAISTRKQPPLPGWKLVANGSLPPPVRLRGAQTTTMPYWIYENQTPLPRAFILGQAKVETEWTASVRALETLDPRHDVIVTKDVLPAGPRSTFREGRIVSYTPDRIALDIENDSPGYVVLTDLYHPGWHCKIDGQAVGVVPVNLGFRGVPVSSAGKHRIEMAYQPPGFLVGALISGVTLVVLIVTVFTRSEAAIEPTMAISDTAQEGDRCDGIVAAQESPASLPALS